MTQFGRGNSATACRNTAAAGLLLAVAACTSVAGPNPSIVDATPPMYGEVVDNGIKIPAVQQGRLDPRYVRRVVRTPANIPNDPGIIVVDPQQKYLYLVQAGGTSMRYGIGVGRQGFAWSGEATIKAKRAWPDWYPPKEMVERDPLAAEWANGMPGGIANPLGARALYLYQGNKDTLYRLHGTSDAASIGKAVSSGCVRLLHQDVIDLYERVPMGTKVIVLGPGSNPMDPLIDFLFPGVASRTPPADVGQI